MAHGRPNMRCGMRGRARDTVWLLAALPSANLLPVAKFVSNGFLINQLGQVDLRLAPQNTRQSVSLPRPLIPHRMFGLTVEDASDGIFLIV
ncbi:hypothetical protein PMF13cell1_02481 [Blautia producta]|uniref:Uncharacterized protein n=1 Tax=Blautia producta TaxID=33035 RepID=A0A4P6LWM7_9FIRM|nr:hypothetical protein PMF13cell1_02481 [Blautia producta]